MQVSVDAPVCQYPLTLPIPIGILLFMELTTAQQTTITEMENEHGQAFWSTAQHFEGITAHGLSICFADGYGWIITTQGIAVPA